MSHRGRRWKSTPSRWGSSSGRPPRRSNQGQQIALNTSTFTPDAVIERVSWRPAYILDAMISIPDELLKPTILARTPTSFSLGLLDTLPIELLYNILNSSDFQSLSRFARVSHGAKILVESLFSYQDTMKHASTALIALSRSSLISYHSAATVHAALLSDKCVCCRGYGVFLFLLTCERCCYQCLQRERSLRAIPITMAETCFGISRMDLSQIPVMPIFPGKYLQDRWVPVPVRGIAKRVRLVSLGQAEKLGLSIHGSQEAMENASVLKKNRKLPNNERLQIRWLMGATLDSEPKLESIFKDDVDSPKDNYLGMASISFPPLRPNGELEKAFWCFGCRNTCLRFGHSENLNRDSDVFMSGLDLIRELSEMQGQARSRSEFLEHTKQCKGARDLLSADGWKGQGSWYEHLMY